jgi:hypothetical protein
MALQYMQLTTMNQHLKQAKRIALVAPVATNELSRMSLPHHVVFSQLRGNDSKEESGCVYSMQPQEFSLVRTMILCARL